MTEKEKMLKGMIYDPFGSDLAKLRKKGHKLSNRYNKTTEANVLLRKKILDKLMPNRGNNVYLQGPVYFDYGIFITMGENSYANFNFTVLDTCPVTIGKNVFIGPNVSLVTPIHPLCYQDRNPHFKHGYMSDDEYGKPITIKDNCWIASNVTVCGGVTIGEGCVIGAGSVVTRDIPDNSLAFGNPCKVIRKITEKDRLNNHKELFKYEV